MNIAFIVNKFPTLSETFVLNQITGLIDRGHQVDILARSPSFEKQIQPDVKKYNLLKKVFYYGDLMLEGETLKKAGNIFDRMFLKLKIKRLFKKLEKKGVSGIGKVSGKKYDLILCAFGNLADRALVFENMGLISFKKMGVSFLGADLTRDVQEKGVDCYKRIFERADFFLPLSEFFKKRVIILGCDEKKVIVHHVGVDCKKFNSRPSGKNETVTILTVARLVEKKGLEYAIRAIKKMRNMDRVKYTILGHGPLLNKLNRLIAELKLEDMVNIVGPGNQEDVITLLKSSGIFLLPSVTGLDGDMEGTPVSIMEAMACRLPVVTTFHSGIPEIVKDKVSGFLAAERDVDALAEKLDLLVGDENLRIKMGDEGRRVIYKEYNIEKLNNELESILEDVLNNDYSNFKSVHL